MAENKQEELKLPEIFDEIWTLYEYLDKCDEPTNSDKVQMKVRHVLELGKKAIQMVNQLHLFSNNEGIDEVATNEIKYMLLSALMGYITQKCTIRERIKVAQESKEYFTDFFNLCKSYGVTDKDLPSENSSEDGASISPLRPNLPDLRQMAWRREDKIRNFKQQKVMEHKLKEELELIKADKVDDEVKRDYYITLLKLWVERCLEELDSTNSEIEVLKTMGDKQGHSKRSVELKEKNKNQTHFRPFIITKDMLQKQVFGAGYPSLPTFTVEEFYQQKVAEGSFHAPGTFCMQDIAADPEKHAKELEKEDLEKEEKREKDDPELLRGARAWDDWKDDHRRGWGNRKNMG
ncbi:hypothetical protein ACJMK2_021404 [Sinanodonta woodiana]|uniref:Immunoglobulin-binding protein 1 n=1 Tax=Sinanodonta woodiana TaxID=1069815 RepID=A0ABD3THG5_SINWO